MKVVVLGAGRRGFRIADYLIAEKNDVVLIDINEVNVTNASSRLDCMAILGSGTDLETLTEAGCSEADAFLAVTNQDEINLVACGIVNTNFNTTTTIAILKNLEIKIKNSATNNILGISSIVNPNMETARYIYNIINRGIYSDVISFNESNFILYNYKVPSDSPMCNTALKYAPKKVDEAFIVAAINRKNKTFVPNGDSKILADDVISIAADQKTANFFMKTNKNKIPKPKKIILVGGSKTSQFLLNFFTPSQRKNIVLIEIKRRVCENFATMFPELLVINADITDGSILNEENLTKSDLIISLTENDELNLITATYAKRIGIKRAMVIVRRQDKNYIRLAPFLEIDTVLSSISITVETVLAKLRGQNVSSIHNIFGGAIEVYQYNIVPDLDICGKRLMEVPKLDHAIVAGITKKNGNLVVPDGSYLLEKGDRVLVIVNRDNTEKLQKIFSRKKNELAK